MITLAAYWKGRDVEYADEVTDDITRNAAITVAKANELLEHAGRTTIDTVNSGWRPKAVNDRTSNAAARSRHLSAEAIDIGDRDRTLAAWCVDNQDVLEELGLWMEDPRWTPNWVHLQTVAPRSNKRVFVPSGDPPKASWPT